MLKILHSSDWHIGKSLYSRSRFDEFTAFLDWLAAVIREEGVDILLVAGDIFDTATPGIRGQELYYHFLHQVMQSHCRHVVIIAGNHDSPAFLSAPEQLLRPLGVHVRGYAGSPEESALLLRDEHGAAMAAVCAVPYLRDRDIRQTRAGESPEDKERALVEGIRDHYAAAVAEAARLAEEAGGGIPILGMGHLFTAGGKTTEGDGVRDLYVGSLGHVPASIFPAELDYLALGHLHVAQRVGGSDLARYSGSPLPLSFSEAGQEKSVCLLECEGKAVTVRHIPVPSFRTLRSLRGTLEELEAAIRALVDVAEPAWLEITHDGATIIPDLRERIEEFTADSQLEVLCVRNRLPRSFALAQAADGETLADLDREEVFTRRLDAENVPTEQREDLLRMYGEILRRMDAGEAEDAPSAEQGVPRGKGGAN